MMKRNSMLAALAVTFAIARSASAAGPNVDEAMSHYQQGVQLFKDGAYEAALVELQKAYKLAPTYKLLYNIAQVHRQLNDFTSAYDDYQRYLKDGGSDIEQGRRDDVRAEMVRLATRIGHIQVRSNADHPSIAIDDAQVVATGDVINANVGRHHVTVTDPDSGLVLSKLVDVVGGETASVEFRFTAKKNEETTNALPVAQPRGPINYTPVWIGLGLTVAALAAGGITGGFALAAKSDYDGQLGQGPNNASALQDAHSRAQGFSIATDIAFGTAIVAGVVTTILYFTRKPSETKHADAWLRAATGTMTF